MQPLARSSLLIVLSLTCAAAAPEKPAPSVDQVLKKLKSTSADERFQAAELLGKMGKAAKAAVPALIHAISDESVKYGEPYVAPAAIKALGDIGASAAPAVDPLRGALKSPKWTIRQAAAGALGKIGPKAVGAAADLVAQWRVRTYTDRWVANDAAVALTRIGEAAIAPVAEALASPAPTARAYAARTLGEFGPAAKEHEKALRKLLADEDALVKLEATIAVLRIAPGAADAKGLGKSLSQQLPGLVRMLGDSGQTEVARMAAAEAIGRSGEAVLPLLDDVLKAANVGRSFIIRATVSDAIAAIGPEAIPKLREWLASEDLAAVELAVLAAKEMGAGAKPALPALIVVVERLGAVKYPNVMATLTCARAIDAIGACGPAAKKAAGMLRKLTKHPEQPVRSASARALTKIEDGGDGGKE
jgi:HEAT repeat protein